MFSLQISRKFPQEKPGYPEHLEHPSLLWQPILPLKEKYRIFQRKSDFFLFINPRYSFNDVHILLFGCCKRKRYIEVFGELYSIPALRIFKDPFTKPRRYFTLYLNGNFKLVVVLLFLFGGMVRGFQLRYPFIMY